MSDENTIRLTATWRSSITIEVPDGIDPFDAVQEINAGCVPDWLEFDASGAELIDWDAVER